MEEEGGAVPNNYYHEMGRTSGGRCLLALSRWDLQYSGDDRNKGGQENNTGARDDNDKQDKAHQLNECDICAGKSNPGGHVTEEMVDDIRATEKKPWKSNTAAEMTRKPPTQKPTVSPLDRVLVMMLQRKEEILCTTK